MTPEEVGPLAPGEEAKDETIIEISKQISYSYLLDLLLPKERVQARIEARNQKVKRVIQTRQVNA